MGFRAFSHSFILLRERVMKRAFRLQRDVMIVRPLTGSSFTLWGLLGLLKSNKRIIVRPRLILNFLHGPEIRAIFMVETHYVSQKRQINIILFFLIFYIGTLIDCHMYNWFLKKLKKKVFHQGTLLLLSSFFFLIFNGEILFWSSLLRAPLMFDISERVPNK